MLDHAREDERRLGSPRYLHHMSASQSHLPLGGSGTGCDRIVHASSSTYSRSDGRRRTTRTPAAIPNEATTAALATSTKSMIGIPAIVEGSATPIAVV